MMKAVLLGTALAVGLTSALAQGDPIAERKKLMKAQGAASREPGLMLRGDQPFDLSKVRDSLKTLVDTNKALAPLWPETSKTGGDTEALPAIWEQRGKFDATLAKLGSDSQAALGTITNEATFKTEFPKVLANCKACHDSFRAKK